MVYCSKCGYKNPDDAEKCGQCEESLVARPEAKPRREMEDECFGLPQGGSIFAIVIGLVIIMVGISFVLQEYFGWEVDVWESIWPIPIIVIGLLIFLGAIYKLTR